MRVKDLEIAGAMKVLNARTEAGSAVKRLVMWPGRGWRQLKGPVWEHENGTRIHTGGLILRDPSGVIAPIKEWEHRKLLWKLTKINGGNKKRGLMAFALNFYAT